jgi:hypothetical protein
METFPLTADDFYARRDDRTNRYTTGDYQTSHCAVTVDVDSIQTLSGQAMLITVCNLLSRWCRRVSIVIPDVVIDKRIDYLKPSAIHFITEKMKDADPFGYFETSQTLTAKADIQLHIGDSLQPCASRSVVIGASGWLAGISNADTLALPQTDSPNIIGPLAAACFGVAQVFKLAIGWPEDQLIADGIFDLFSLGRVSPVSPLTDHDYLVAPDLGKLLMIGAGSVGSAVAYCLNLMNASCELDLVDHDIVNVQNFSRSPIFGKGSYGIPKVDALAAYLSDSSVLAKPHNMWWDDFIRKTDRKSDRFDIWMSLANEFGVRWSMQHNYPPLLVHASTTQNWGVNHGRHRFRHDDCLIDRFPAEMSDNALRCSTGEVTIESEHVDAALPFLSLFAGVLVAAELARLQLPEYPQCPNFALMDFGGDMSEIQAWDMKARSSCFCQTQSAAIHESFNGGTRYLT